MAAASDAVHLILPASPRHLRLARLTAAGIAGDLGFSLESIEDLRVAVDELCAALIDEVPAGTRLTVVYRVDGEDVRIEGHVAVDGADPVELHPVARELLGIVADEYELRHEEGGRSFRLLKRGQHRAGGR